MLVTSSSGLKIHLQLPWTPEKAQGCVQPPGREEINNLAHHLGFLPGWRSASLSAPGREKSVMDGPLGFQS